MYIRQAIPQDQDELRRLFFETVTAMNIKDYGKKQVDTWASISNSTDVWVEKIQNQYFVVACAEDGTIIGFATLTFTGYIDLLFIHKDHQGAGIASKLVNDLIEEGKRRNIPKMWADANITARPFFESKGFTLVQTHLKKTDNDAYPNFVMVKNLL